MIGRRERCLFLLLYGMNYALFILCHFSWLLKSIKKKKSRDFNLTARVRTFHFTA